MQAPHPQPSPRGRPAQPPPHARIREIDASPALALPGVRAVVTGRDGPGVKYGVFPHSRDQYLLALDKVRYVGDEVAAVAAVDQDIAEEDPAAANVEITPQDVRFLKSLKITLDDTL